MGPETKRALLAVGLGSVAGFVVGEQVIQPVAAKRMYQTQAITPTGQKTPLDVLAARAAATNPTQTSLLCAALGGLAGWAIEKYV
jgi:hypothetical protein